MLDELSSEVYYKEIEVANSMELNETEKNFLTFWACTFVVIALTGCINTCMLAYLIQRLFYA